MIKQMNLNVLILSNSYCAEYLVFNYVGAKNFTQNVEYTDQSILNFFAVWLLTLILLE